MKRMIAVAAMPLILGGCLPIPVTIASTAISGISYMQTGKFSADHVLSAFAEQDCELTRPLTGEAMCQALDPESAAAGERVVVAAYPGDRDSGSFRSNNDPEISLGAMKVEDREEPVLVAAALSFSPPFRAPIETPGLVSTDKPVLAAPKAMAGAMPPVPIARPVLVARSIETPVAATLVSTVSVSAPIEPWTPPANYVRGHRSERAMPVAATTQAPAGEQRYVVIGSVRDTGRAVSLAERFADRNAEIRPVDVDGQIWHRVLVGPYGLRDAQQAKADLGIVDGHQPWIIRLAPRGEGDQVAMR